MDPYGLETAFIGKLTTFTIRKAHFQANTSSGPCSKLVTKSGVTIKDHTGSSTCWAKNNLTHSLTLDLKLDLCELVG